MKVPFFVLVVLSLILLAAHFLRSGSELGVAVSLAPIALLFLREPWAARVVQAVLVLGAIEWTRTLYELMQLRLAQGVSATGVVIILGAVIAVTIFSALLFEAKTMKRIYNRR